MHHCNIMYPSCDTIYTGVMLNVTRFCIMLLHVFLCFYSLSYLCIEKLFTLSNII